MTPASPDQTGHEALERQGLYLVVAIVLLTLWGMILWFSAQQKARLLADSSRELSFMNAAVAANASSLLQTMETDLRLLDDWLQQHPGADPLTDPAFIALVDELRRSSGGLLDLRAVGSDGGLYYLPAADHRARTNVADRDYVSALKPPGSAPLRIGQPVLSRVTGLWGLPVSWRLAHPVGGVGILFANIELERLGQLHETLRMQPQGTISWVRGDGILLTRVPYDASLFGKDISASPLFQQELRTHARGSFVSDGAVTDGVPRLFTYQRLERFPVTVLVSRGQAEVLETYYQRRTVVLLIAGAVTLLVIGFTVALRRSLLALRRTQRELRELAGTDPLTGVMNRRALLERAAVEADRARRFEHPLTLAVIDIDHFKRLNDAHGHAYGDRVLRECARLWERHLRDADLLGRIGGEEFGLVLIEADAAMAAEVLQRLAQATAEASFGPPVVPGGSQVTVSIGAASWRMQDPDWSTVFARADRALYEAKARGRNRVEMADDATAPAAQGGPAVPSAQAPVAH